MFAYEDKCSEVETVGNWSVQNMTMQHAPRLIMISVIFRIGPVIPYSNSSNPLNSIGPIAEQNNLIKFNLKHLKIKLYFRSLIIITSYLDLDFIDIC